MLDSHGRIVLTAPVILQRIDRPHGDQPWWRCDVEECRWRQNDEDARAWVCSITSGGNSLLLADRADTRDDAGKLIQKRGSCASYIPRWMMPNSINGDWTEVAGAENTFGTSVVPRARGGTR